MKTVIALNAAVLTLLATEDSLVPLVGADLFFGALDVVIVITAVASIIKVVQNGNS